LHERGLPIEALHGVVNREHVGSNQRTTVRRLPSRFKASKRTLSRRRSWRESADATVAALDTINALHLSKQLDEVNRLGPTLANREYDARASSAARLKLCQEV
jgi:hypothetical protein